MHENKDNPGDETSSGFKTNKGLDKSKKLPFFPNHQRHSLILLFFNDTPEFLTVQRKTRNLVKSRL